MNGLLYDGVRAWALMRQPDVDLEVWRRRVRLWASDSIASDPASTVQRHGWIEIARIAADDSFHSRRSRAKHAGADWRSLVDYINWASRSISCQPSTSYRRVGSRNVSERMAVESVTPADGRMTRGIELWALRS